MVRSRKIDFFSYDWLSIFLFLIISLTGILLIHSVDTYHFDFPSFWQSHAGKQALWLIFSLVMSGIIVLINHKFFIRWSSAFYLAALLLLALVLVAGHKVAGARSWFRIGSLGFQPAESAKWMVSLGLAKLISEPDFSPGRFKGLFQAGLLIGIPVGLILLQPDAGTVLIFLGAYLVVLYRFGLRGLWLFPALWLVLLFLMSIRYPAAKVTVVLSILTVTVAVAAFYFTDKKRRWRVAFLAAGIGLVSIGWVRLSTYTFGHVLKPHQQKRIEILLGKLKDEKGAGYHLRQSLIAIGNGGMEGRGYLQGSQLQGRFIPEQHTDYIFTVMAEQFGFVGSTLFLLIYLALIVRIFFLAERQKNLFASVFGYALGAFLAVHFFLNVMMTMGLFPTVGIPIPFVSYGGSSLWNFVIFLILFLHFDAARHTYLS